MGQARFKWPDHCVGKFSHKKMYIVYKRVPTKIMYILI